MKIKHLFFYVTSIPVFLPSIAFSTLHYLFKFIDESYNELLNRYEF